jgi:hypothetical protein
MKGLEAYKAGQKKNWRGWLWNRATERLTTPVENAVVLYLAGPEDHDRQKAIARGYRNENVIAVDIDADNIERVRRAGGIGICANLTSVLLAWPEDWPIHAILGDFCGGLAGPAADFAMALWACEGMRPGTVVAVNLQRGRDAVSNEVRSLLSRIGYGKHRGKAFMGMMLGYIRVFEKNGAITRQQRELGERFIEHKAAYNSYTSTGRTWFDTVVFKWPGVLGKGCGVDDDELDAEVARKVAALRAVRTMKQRAA